MSHPRLASVCRGPPLLLGRRWSEHGSQPWDRRAKKGAGLARHCALTHVDQIDGQRLGFEFGKNHLQRAFRHCPSRLVGQHARYAEARDRGVDGGLDGIHR